MHLRPLRPRGNRVGMRNHRNRVWYRPSRRCLRTLASQWIPCKRGSCGSRRRSGTVYPSRLQCALVHAASVARTNVVVAGAGRGTTRARRGARRQRGWSASVLASVARRRRARRHGRHGWSACVLTLESPPRLPAGRSRSHAVNRWSHRGRPGLPGQPRSRWCWWSAAVLARWRGARRRSRRGWSACVLTLESPPRLPTDRSRSHAVNRWSHRRRSAGVPGPPWRRGCWRSAAVPACRAGCHSRR